ncbi:hypothetical protein LAZ67_3001932 [Cordylochernes scorpioides]|uniref:Uncharacterized protein n=1 Tax=Cordylochernes scorpioides TaxID=51811 RepID=A0ABY6K930_9ARAC|nr:hypothetical protein LAZ67_3001932 [Cordylochernes scorpioides]
MYGVRERCHILISSSGKLDSTNGYKKAPPPDLNNVVQAMIILAMIILAMIILAMIILAMIILPMIILAMIILAMIILAMIILVGHDNHGVKDVNLAAARDVTLNLPAGTSSNGAARVLGNWADCIDDFSPGAEDDFNVVKTKKRRRESSNSPTAAAPSSNSGGARSSRRLHSSARSVPRAQEIPTTRTHITEARARQASSSEEHCVYLEHGPELQPFHYLRAQDRLLGGTAGIIQISKVNGHQLLGLANRDLAERLINNGLEVEGTLLRAFSFRKRAERITVGNLPFFVEDSAIIKALGPYGRIISIAPKMMKAGPYTYTDGCREAFIVLHEGVTTERLPTRLNITIKGEAWPAYLSSGIKCSRCHGQWHRRANCPLLAGRTTAPGPATPTSPTSVPPATAPRLPQQPSTQPPPPASPSPTMVVSDAPPTSRAALHPPAALRQSPPAPSALRAEDAPPAPPPVNPAPSLRTPGSRDPAAPTPDVEMSIVEETSASSASSAKNAHAMIILAMIILAMIILAMIILSMIILSMIILAMIILAMIILAMIILSMIILAMIILAMIILAMIILVECPISKPTRVHSELSKSKGVHSELSKSTRVHSELSKSKGVHSELSKSAGVHSDLSKSTRLCSRVTVSNFEPTELQTQLSNPLTSISSQPERGHKKTIESQNRVDNLPSYPMSPEQSYTLSSASVEDFKAQSGPKSPTSPTRGSESCRYTQGLLRVGGRLKYSYLNENQKFPLLQPKSPRQESLIKNILTENADIPEAIDENQEDSSILETTFVIEDEESNKDIGTPKIEISEVSVIDKSEGKYSKEPVVSVEALDKKELCHDDPAHLNVVEADINRPKEATSGIINISTEANESASKEKAVSVEIVDTSTKDYLQSGEKAKLSRWKPIDSLCLEDVKESEDDDENYSSSAYIEWPEILKKEVLRPEALEKAVNLEDFEKAAESRQLSKEHLEESTEQGSCIKAESKTWEDPIESDLAAAESDNPAVPERELANESENLIQDSPQSDTQRWKLIPLPFKQ